MLEGFETLADLDKYVGKYVDITWDDEGCSGWVDRVGPVEESIITNVNGSHHVVGRNVILDYGYGGFLTFEGISIKEVEPPTGDKGPFKCT